MVMNTGGVQRRDGIAIAAICVIYLPQLVLVQDGSQIHALSSWHNIGRATVHETKCRNIQVGRVATISWMIALNNPACMQETRKESHNIVLKMQHR